MRKLDFLRQYGYNVFILKNAHIVIYCKRLLDNLVSQQKILLNVHPLLSIPVTFLTVFCISSIPACYTFRDSWVQSASQGGRASLTYGDRTTGFASALFLRVTSPLGEPEMGIQIYDCSYNMVVALAQVLLAS
jgi:hypothetical protein